jgi:uncharacterized membrane protein YfcA
VVLPTGALVGLPPTLDFLALIAVAFGAGIAGSMLGLGGGLFIVPALYLLFAVDIRLAVAASVVSVVATSVGSAATNIERGWTNLRLGMFLEVSTVIGGLLGALLTVTILATHETVLIVLFVPVVLFSAVMMYRRRERDVEPNPPPDRIADALHLEGMYPDPRTGQPTPYRVTRAKTGLCFGGIAGVSSGLLGIGGGVFKVPAMTTFMNVPMRAATATSNFMIGVTAVSGALVYLLAGLVSFSMAAPVALGVLGGSLVGVRIAPRAPLRFLKSFFVAILVLAALLMLLEGTGVIA